jgi:hypothetical protein
MAVALYFKKIKVVVVDVEEDVVVVLQVLVPVLGPGLAHVAVYALVQGKI